MTSARARQLGIPFRGTPGPWNAITDVAGVEVGYCTLISGSTTDANDPAVRTGVTVIFPRGKASRDPVFAGLFALNGAGEMTGVHWMSESGFLESAISITNTHSVGAVHAAVIKWQVENGLMFGEFSMPVVTETFDGFLNDTNGFHIREEHVLAAIADAKCAPVAEGNVGGGTGMRLFGWKGGSGTSSRVVSIGSSTYTVGTFIQGNFGRREDAIVAGVPIGLHASMSLHSEGSGDRCDVSGRGSIIVIVATDAPLLPHQLNRMAKRAALGIARTGGNAANTSGDIIVAISTANASLARPQKQPAICETLSNESLDTLFGPVIDATEEAIVNALVAGETMSGFQGHVVSAIPLTALRAILREYNRLNEG